VSFVTPAPQRRIQRELPHLQGAIQKQKSKKKNDRNLGVPSGFY
jgi:hypothetical protein